MNPDDVRLPDASSGRRLDLPRTVETDWQMLVVPPGGATEPADLTGFTTWRSAAVPGTALTALGVVPTDVSLEGERLPRLHDHDIWYRAQVDILEGDEIIFNGLAGLAEIWLGSRAYLRSDSMFVRHRIVARESGRQTLWIRFRSLTEAMKAPLPRARWRTRLVSNNALRGQRQTLLGHMPGWCPPCHAVGSYRSVEIASRNGTIVSKQLSARLRGRDGILSVRIDVLGGDPCYPDLSIRAGGREVELHRQQDGTFAAELLIPEVRRWWPHTHGRAELYNVDLIDGRDQVPLGTVGFRSLRIDRGADGNEFRFVLNDIPIFCRGACWSNVDIIGLDGSAATYRPWLETARDAGLNMIRIGGTMLYESSAFHEICDELGILVWQDLMFANMDVPIADDGLRARILSEVEQLIERLDGSPSLAIICGGSEMAQQAALLGLDATKRHLRFFEVELPEFISARAPEMNYIPNSPWGGALPTALGEGVSHYYGVGAYLRPVDDARRAGIRFASECLAFANPDDPGISDHRYFDIVPRDNGATWNFGDTRDHYLRELYDIDAASLRRQDTERYTELSRAVTADLLEAAFSAWRRVGSTCAGGLVWQLQDVCRGSGWGLIDSRGDPKPALHGLRRVAAPLQILVSDEGLDGLLVHVINETPERVLADVELRALRDGTVEIAVGHAEIEVGPFDAVAVSSQALLGRFFDITHAWRFGPAEHDVTVVMLRARGDRRIVSQAFHFPGHRLLPRSELHLDAEVRGDDAGWVMHLSCDRVAQAVHLVCKTHRAETDWFHLAPAYERSVPLRRRAGVRHAGPPTGVVRAINGVQEAPLRIAA